MGKVKGKHRLDKFYRLAKEHGYRSRASWKLVQLDAKFHFLHSSRAVLDLCAAPGGWMQVAVQRVPVGSLVLGIDLVKIAPVRGAVAIEQDITKPECKARIKKIMGENGVKAFDLVLHDGSPNIGGAWSQEAMTQNSLVIDAVRLATQYLAPKGTFVTKVFRSQDYNSVIYCLNQLFEKVEVDKPAASRSASAEIFVLGLKYKAPAKIDPRLLDVKHLFQGSIEPQRKVIDVLRGQKQKRHRDGYEDGESIIRKVSSAADFVFSNTPLEILGSVTSISFEDPASLPLKDHALTTEEVKALCDDLRVLGKQDFKHLLKWRMHIKKALSPSQKATSTTSTDGEEKTVEDEDDKLLNEMEEMTYAVERKKKQAKKRDAKRRAKDKTRKGKGMQIDALEDGYVDHELFSLSSIKGKKDLVAVNSAENDDDNGELGDSENEGRHDLKEHSSSDLDSDEERMRYDEKMEDFLDQVYERFTAKKEGSAKQRKRARKAYSELLEGDDNAEAVQSDYDSDKDQGDEEVNPLMVPFNDGEVPTEEEITNKWFAQDVFAKAVEDGDLEKSDSEDEMQIDKKEKKHDMPLKVANVAVGPKDAQPKTLKGEEDFEIVPTAATDSSDDSSSDDSDEEDVESKAEVLAYAKKMLRKKQREHMLDDAYNRYMFDDEGLPGWFLEEERRHRQAMKPVTKEEIAAMKAQFKEINARPAKKVAQAKARKKRLASKRLEKVRKKANTISDQADICDRSKSKMIEQLYKKAEPKRPKKEYVVAKKGVAVKGGKGKVVVDRRMKSDARKHGMGKRGGKGSSKKGKNAKGVKGKGPGKGSAKNGKSGNRGKTGGSRA
ncbi:uncharacterized protein LOC126680766 [Mercurialis annua]|uniref:uncharacterized protein LOC126680766 n=1 Tax=Mercurialis annua TaxID=3986 RepID=UPI00215EE843|nr:uncharacterized protein LOC126680766 [Mercurialis annua]